jgi:arylsulfatase A-like enzyme
VSRAIRFVLLALAAVLLTSVTVATSAAKPTATTADPPAAGNGFEASPTQQSMSLAPLVGQPKRPNIVVIMTDDARNDDLQYMPHVRHLIEDQGVRFTNTFSPQPLCCPARASFLTGEYSHNHHVWSHVFPFGFRALRDKSTVPVWLNDVGYDTIFLGKYLNGYGIQTLRNGQPSLRYVPPGWTNWMGSVDGGIAAGTGLDGGTYRYFDTTLNDNGRLEAHQGAYQTDLFAHISEDVFRQEALSPHPFFYWASFVAPHYGSPAESDDPKPIRRTDGKLQTFETPARPKSVWSRFDNTITHAPGYRGEKNVSDKPFFIRDLPPESAKEQFADTEVARQRAQSLWLVDRQVAKMMRVLKETGQLDNTYVLFTSDNGYFLGEHRMRQGKILPYEPSLRVPLLIRGPGIPKGQTRSDPFMTPDFAPTFLQMAGARPEAQDDGISLLGVAEHGDVGWTRGILTETGPRDVSGDVGESDNFLQLKHGPSPLRFSQGVRTGDYLYVEHASHEKELYDLRTDEREVHNLVYLPKERRVVRALAKMLDELRNCKGVGCSIPLPKFLQTTHPAPTFPDGAYD